jgi:prevent-host-death family protein
MITVGAFEAKTHLSSLLDKVEAGQDVLITRHGLPIARLVKVENIAHAKVDLAVEQLKATRIGRRLNADWKELRDEGRR